MRSIVFATSFLEDADIIAAAITKRFGHVRANTFIEALHHLCILISENPGLGRDSHGYETALSGVVHHGNWIFFQHDEDEIRFIHMVDAKREKSAIRF